MNKKIEMVDLYQQYKKIQKEIQNSIEQVIESCHFINGPQVSQFCEHLAAYNGIKHVIPCANGTDALQIAFMTLGLQPGDEVIVPVHTYVATAEVIALLHLKPVFVDCDPDYFTIDISQIESKITSRTKAIVPVHLYGQCVDMEPLLQIAACHNLYVVEDAAQAIGAEYRFSNGQMMKAGCMGHIGTTSFFPSKNLGCYGDGGALFINDDELAIKAKMVANHGQSQKYHHDIIGCNSRLDTIQAAILDIKLKYLDLYRKARNEAADLYDSELSDINGLTIPSRYSQSTHVFHQYTIKVEDQLRDQLREYLTSKNIPSMIYYPIPLHLQKAYSKDNNGSFPVAEHLSKTVLSLPIHTEIDKEQITYICETIRTFLNSK